MIRCAARHEQRSKRHFDAVLVVPRQIDDPVPSEIPCGKPAGTGFATNSGEVTETCRDAIDSDVDVAQRLREDVAAWATFDVGDRDVHSKDAGSVKNGACRRADGRQGGAL